MSAPNVLLRRRVRLYGPFVSSKEGPRWQVASGESGPACHIISQLALKRRRMSGDTRSHRLATERLRPDSLCKSGSDYKAIITHNAEHR